MGRRKGRKRRGRSNRETLGAEALRRSENRRRRRRSDDDGFAGALAAAPADDPRTLAWQEPGPRSLVAMVRDDLAPGARPALTCEGCHEFVQGDTGRGRCLHPGSGIVAPWPDTEACQFHEARRRR